MELIEYIIFFMNTGQDVMFQLTERIPMLKSRTQKQGGGEQQPQSSAGKKGKKKGKR